MREREPTSEFVLLLGADAAADLPSWKEGERVSEFARIVVFGRGGAPVPTLPWITAAIEVPAIGISATEIRRRARLGQPIRYWVPHTVAEYIAAHQLYLNSE
jgi:nicotinate-nucleotide adenylyltransferase